MSKAIVNALTLKLIADPETALPFPLAQRIAEEFVAENAELFAPVKQVRVAGPMAFVEDALPVEDESLPPLPPRPPRDPNALMPAQQVALQRGIPLCPNCQQPANDHLPGCARVEWNGWEAVDKRAVTKNKLSPVE